MGASMHSRVEPFGYILRSNIRCLRLTCGRAGPSHILRVLLGGASRSSMSIPHVRSFGMIIYR